MNPIEEAEGFRDLIASTNPPMTQEQAAEAVGKSRPVVANALRVLELPEKVVELIRSGKLTLAHGVALARFKAWPMHVTVMAETAVADGWKASQLEKGIPAARELQNAGLAVSVYAYNFGGEIPPALKKGPAIFKDGDYATVCFDAALYEQEVKAHKEAQKAERAAEEERDRKRIEALAKNPKKIKSLEDLPHGSYVHLNGDRAKETMALLPEATQLELKDGEGKANVCTKPDLFHKIDAAVSALKQADRKEKWTKIVVETLGAIAGTKKLGPREMMLPLYLSSTSDNYNGPEFFVHKASSLDVKFPKKALNDHYEGQINFEPRSLALLLAEVGPVDCWRVLMDSWVRKLENDLVDSDYNCGPDSDLGTVCLWILEREELGFLEETKAGQRQLLEAVQAQEWYQREVAEIEGREYVAPPAGKDASEAAKPTKKGGKK